MIPNRKVFYIAFPSIPEPVSDVWRTIISCLEEEKSLPDRFHMCQLSGHPPELKSETDLILTPDEISTLIDERELTGFHCKTWKNKRGLGFDLHHMKQNGKQSVLWIHVKENTRIPSDWAPLIEALMAQWNCIGGWQWRALYLAWQWVSHMSRGYEQYMYADGRPPGLRTHIQKSEDGIGPDREIIDNSLNPGRKRDLLKGIFFLPTAEMWLGPHFWQYAKCTKEEVLAADFFLEKRDTPHFLYLKSWPEPFTRPDGEQGRQQQRIWQLFFNEDCEWPPGSGTICEEPMYGPPELMP